MKTLKAKLKHSPVLLFKEYYWNPECVIFNDTFGYFCQFLTDEVERLCPYWTPMSPIASEACQTAQDFRFSICGSWIGQINEGSGEDGPDLGTYYNPYYPDYPYY